MSNEQEAVINIFSEERSRREKEEENLRKKLKVKTSFRKLSSLFHVTLGLVCSLEKKTLLFCLKDASNTIQELLDKVRMLEKMKSPNGKP